ncbi:MAG: Iron(III) ABC transporter, periplasmic-binding protein, partial [uncultured Rubrobacteraceae bacterium]
VREQPRHSTGRRLRRDRRGLRQPLLPVPDSAGRRRRCPGEQLLFPERRSWLPGKRGGARHPKHGRQHGRGPGVPGVHALRGGPAVLRRRDLRVPAHRGGSDQRGTGPALGDTDAEHRPEQPRRPGGNARAAPGDGDTL